MFMALTGWSQDLLHTDMLPFGSKMDLKQSSSFSVVDTTIKGSGAIWDFSNIIEDPSLPSLEVLIEDPANTPYAASFPTANYAYVETPTGYRYFDLNDSVMERVGSWFGGLLKTYSDPQVEYVFPMGLDSANNDTWDNSASSFGGNYDLKVMGQGKLILPDATYENAFMVYVELEEIFTTEVYFWYSVDNGAILAQYVIGDGFFIGTQLRYLSNLTISTGLEDEQFISELVYPNPMGNVFNLTFTSEQALQLRYNLTNSYGQRISYGDLDQAPSQSHELQLKTSNLSSGIYYLMLIDKNNPKRIRTLKLIK